MRTFILRARKGSTRWQRIRAQVGAKEHFEVVLHAVINAFFVSSDFRTDVEMYIVLDSAEDFPHTIHLSAQQGLSLAGFHEEAILQLLESALKNSVGLKKDQIQVVAPGVSVLGMGFDRLLAELSMSRQIYLLDKKGEGIQAVELASDPVFVLSDHLAMPQKSIKGLVKRHQIKTLSLGKRMLFASQCIVLLNYAMDNISGIS